MPKNHKTQLENLPEVFVSEPSIYDFVYRKTKEGHLRKIGSRLYTRNLEDTPEAIVKRNIWPLVAAYFPGALIADRTALEHKPSEDGTIFIISEKKRGIDLPGFHIQPRKGVEALSSDRPFVGGLYISSQARAYLENMRPSRARAFNIPRTLSRHELEEKLDTLLRRNGEAALQKLREEAKVIALEINMQEEAKALDDLIGAFLGTRNVPFQSENANMRRKGTPYDPDRLPLFERLFEKLENTAPVLRTASGFSKDAMINLAFFEAYFSNFIEGTEFAINEAEEIIFAGKIPKGRPEDAHDVLGTYHIISDNKEMQQIPKSFDALLALLQSRHGIVMASRKDKNPGHFKTETNRAGGTVFVAPELVEGTLLKGFEIYQALTTPFARAVFMMFLVAEVHPFADGNGRLARIMMNAELVATKQQRIIIPTIYRNNYLSALKAISLSHQAEPLIRMLDFAQKYTHAINWNNLENARTILQNTHAFDDPQQADQLGIRLTVPY